MWSRNSKSWFACFEFTLYLRKGTKNIYFLGCSRVIIHIYLLTLALISSLLCHLPQQQLTVHNRLFSVLTEFACACTSCLNERSMLPSNEQSSYFLVLLLLFPSAWNFIISIHARAMLVNGAFELCYSFAYQRCVRIVPSDFCLTHILFCV